MNTRLKSQNILPTSGLALNSAAYRAWVRQGGLETAEVIAGIRLSAKDIRLDTAGLVSRGWRDDIPVSWSVKPGEPPEVGGYNEDRSIYGSPAYRPADGQEPRTRHLGIDIFVPDGTAVFAPVGGVVHSFQDNAAFKDYGPTIILKHSPCPDLSFYSLYGHLSRGSLDLLVVGEPFKAGAPLGSVGTVHENGGWPPHLHFQIILDLMDNVGDFPGVCRNSERRFWTTVCPDPAGLLGLKGSLHAAYTDELASPPDLPPSPD